MRSGGGGGHLERDPGPGRRFLEDHGHGPAVEASGVPLRLRLHLGGEVEQGDALFLGEIVDGQVVPFYPRQSIGGLRAPRTRPVPLSRRGARRRIRMPAARRSCAPWRRTPRRDRKSTRLNSSHGSIAYAAFCLKKKKKKNTVICLKKKKKKKKSIT